MLMLTFISMLMSHASVVFFVLSIVLPCAYAYVASENQALDLPLYAVLVLYRNVPGTLFKKKTTIHICVIC